MQDSQLIGREAPYDFEYQLLLTLAKETPLEADQLDEAMDDILGVLEGYGFVVSCKIKATGALPDDCEALDFSSSWDSEEAGEETLWDTDLMEYDI